MKHTLYERMILADEPLSGAQQIWLDSHLRICGQCAELSKNWHAVRIFLKNQNPALPAPGFLSRIMFRLAADGL
jgi:hypothetical protein